MARHGRREEITDTLAGAAQIVPAQLQGPGIQAPSMPQPKPSVTGQIAAELGQWADGFLKEAVSKENERNMMDGAIAATQGVALEQLEMRGADKWSLEGHRVLTAQTVSSQLQAAQVQLIEDSAFALGPDQYRAQLTEQLAAMTDGQDPATARMVREQLSGMLPELVSRQTLAHANYQEQQVYDAVVQSIPAMSSDAQGASALLDMATGAHPSAAGLSKARLDQGIMEGIVLSFVNGNPRAYDIMKAGGVLDSFTTDQLNRINNAETQYQTRLRGELNTGRLAQHQTLDAEMRHGDMTPWEYQNRYLAIDASFGIDSKYADANAAYGRAIDPANTAGKTRFLVAGEAIDRGDWKAFGAATVGLVLHAESGHDAPPDIEGPLVTVGANAGTRAQSPMQVMPPTLADPGFGLRPSNGSDEDNLRLGEEYWTVMTAGSLHPSGKFKWAMGDIESAAIAYIAGFGNANKFIAAGRDYSALPDREQAEPYAKAILKAYKDQQTPLVGDAHNVAVANAATTRKRVQAEKYAQASMFMAQEDKRWIDGEIDRATWKSNRDAIRDHHGVLMTTSIANAEIATTKARFVAASKVADETAMFNISLEMNPVEFALQGVLDNDAATDQEMQTAVQSYILARNEIYRKNGVLVTDTTNTAGIKGAMKKWRSVTEQHTKWSEEQAEIDFAAANGGVGDLLSNELQERFFDQQAKARAVELQQQYDMSAQTEVDQAVADSNANEGAFYAYKDAGTVDARFRAAESHVMNASLIVLNQDGTKTVNQKAVQSIERYVRFKEIAPELSAQFYNLEARTRAESILETAGPGGNLPDAAFLVGTRLAMTQVQRDAMDAFQISAQTQAEVSEAVGDLIDDQDIGLLQAMFNRDTNYADIFTKLPTEEQAVRGDVVKALVHSGLERWLMRLKTAMPGADARTLVPMAAQELMRHSAFIGDTFVQMNKDVMQETFGGQANMYAGPNAVNNAILHYMASPGFLKDHPELDDTTIFSYLPRHLQEAGVGVLNLFGANARVPNESLGGAIQQRWRNVSRLTASVDVDGELLVQAWTLRGVPGTPLQIDLRAAGDLFKKDFPATPDAPNLNRRANEAANTMINRGVRVDFFD